MGDAGVRRLGIDKTKFIKTGHEHKLDKIRRILEVCQSLPFILIGDAGQHDPQLYPFNLIRLMMTMQSD